MTSQFEIVGIDEQTEGTNGKKSRMYINGKRIYARIFIKKSV